MTENCMETKYSFNSSNFHRKSIKIFFVTLIVVVFLKQYFFLFCLLAATSSLLQYCAMFFIHVWNHYMVEKEKKELVQRLNSIRSFQKKGITFLPCYPLIKALLVHQRVVNGILWRYKKTVLLCTLVVSFSLLMNHSKFALFSNYIILLSDSIISFFMKEWWFCEKFWVKYTMPEWNVTRTGLLAMWTWISKL